MLKKKKITNYSFTQNFVPKKNKNFFYSHMKKKYTSDHIFLWIFVHYYEVLLTLPYIMFRLQKITYIQLLNDV